VQAFSEGASTQEISMESVLNKINENLTATLSPRGKDYRPYTSGSMLKIPVLAGLQLATHASSEGHTCF